MAFRDILIIFVEDDIDQKEDRDSAINHQQRLVDDFGIEKFHEFLEFEETYELIYILNGNIPFLHRGAHAAIVEYRKVDTLSVNGF